MSTPMVVIEVSNTSGRAVLIENGRYFAKPVITMPLALREFFGSDAEWNSMAQGADKVERSAFVECNGVRLVLGEMASIMGTAVYPYGSQKYQPNNYLPFFYALLYKALPRDATEVIVHYSYSPGLSQDEIVAIGLMLKGTHTVSVNGSSRRIKVKISANSPWMETVGGLYYGAIEHSSQFPAGVGTMVVAIDSGGYNGAIVPLAVTHLESKTSVAYHITLAGQITPITGGAITIGHALVDEIRQRHKGAVVQLSDAVAALKSKHIYISGVRTFIGDLVKIASSHYIRQIVAALNTYVLHNYVPMLIGGTASALFEPLCEAYFDDRGGVRPLIVRAEEPYHANIVGMGQMISARLATGG